MNRTSKRIVAIGTPLAAVAATGIAFAAWTATGSGSGYAKATTAQALTTVDVSATVVAGASGLYPGGTTGLDIKIHNPNSYPVLVTGVAAKLDATHFVVGTGGGGSCTDDPSTESTPGNAATLAHPTGVSFSGWASPADGTAIAVAASGDTEVTLAGKVSMSNTSDNGCQGATFSIPVTLSGASNA